MLLCNSCDKIINNSEKLCEEVYFRSNQMNETINIVLCSDDNYAQHIAVVMASVMANTKAQVCFLLLMIIYHKEK